MIVANNITDLIGWTPLLRLNKLPGPQDAKIFLKLEWYNVGGSVKDRMAKYLIEYAESAGKISKDKTILEATSGNTGIALAMISAAKGYRIAITMPESVSVERRKLIQAYGAELILSPGVKGTAGAIELKQKLLRENPGKFIDIDQFKDPANIMAHYHTTGREIIEQTKGVLDMIVVGIGTAGTGVGTSMRVKQYNPNIRIVGVTPELGFAIQGLRNPNEAYPTQLYRSERFDEVVELPKKMMSTIRNVAQRTAKEEGLLVGISAAAIIYVSLQKAHTLGKGKRIVAILPDSGSKYLSTDLFGD
jgi:cysteine synthase